MRKTFILITLFLITIANSIHSRGHDHTALAITTLADLEPIFNEIEDMRMKMGEKAFRQKSIEELKYFNRLNKNNMKPIRVRPDMKKYTLFPIVILDLETNRILDLRDKAFLYYIMEYNLRKSGIDYEIISLLEERVNRTTPEDPYFDYNIVHIHTIQKYIYLIKTKEMDEDKRLEYLLSEAVNNYHKNPDKFSGAIAALNYISISKEGIKRLQKEYEKHLEDEDCKFLSTCISTYIRTLLLKNTKMSSEDVNELIDIVQKSGLKDDLKQYEINMIKNPFPYGRNSENYQFPSEKLFKKYE
jgi:hypothetical protein